MKNFENFKKKYKANFSKQNQKQVDLIKKKALIYNDQQIKPHPNILDHPKFDPKNCDFYDFIYKDQQKKQLNILKPSGLHQKISDGLSNHDLIQNGKQTKPQPNIVHSPRSDMKNSVDYKQTNKAILTSEELNFYHGLKYSRSKAFILSDDELDDEHRAHFSL